MLICFTKKQRSVKLRASRFVKATFIELRYTQGCHIYSIIHPSMWSSCLLRNMCLRSLYAHLLVKFDSPGIVYRETGFAASTFLRYWCCFGLLGELLPYAATSFLSSPHSWWIFRFHSL
ncbi:hypothetical protein CW304_06985 [Bacillus sp. UFRGS-B20]|nr:hypothetical protein CW304_06985 [Bacillus sp. UFRGS-B20]